jgi:peptide/nickel transport system permease protein
MASLLGTGLSRSRVRAAALAGRSIGASAIVGTVILVIIVAIAILAPLIAPYPPNQIDLLGALQAPSWSHLMGTDDVGRDVLSRVIYGIRLDLVVVLFVTYLPLPIGVLLGTAAGYFGGVSDSIISRTVDVVIAFPNLVLVIAVVAIMGPGLAGAMVGIIFAGWAMYARLARGDMLVLRERQFMLATKALAYSHTRSILRHALPSVLRSSVVFSASDIVINLLVLAGLSYIGLGVQPPTPELGAIVASGQSYLLTAWWIATLPGLVIVLIGLAVSMVGDAIGDRWGLGNV